MRATEEQTGRCSLGKKKGEQDWFTNSGVLSQVHTLRQAGCLIASDRAACVCKHSGESLLHTPSYKYTHTHTNSQTFTWTWVNQSDLRGSFPAAIVFIGQWRTKQCGNGQVCIKELFKTLKHPYTAFARLSQFHKREGLGDLFCDFCSPQTNYSQVITGNSTDYS